MNTKNSVKLRRQQKIKELLERQSSVPRREEPIIEGTEADLRPESHTTVLNTELYRETHNARRYEADELDPEAVWKANPNPWASWSGNIGFGERNLSVKQAGRLPVKDMKPGKHPFRKELQWKLAIALILFGGVWAMFSYDSEMTRKGQAVVKQALTEEIDFAAAAAWYRDNFSGAPSFIPIFGEEPNEAIGTGGTVKLPIVAPLQDGSLVRTFAELLNGIELAGASEETVVAAESGRVIVLTEAGAGGASIVIEHANKRVTVYGKLGETSVGQYEWVEAGDPIGKLMKTDGAEPSLLYFAVKENDEYVDPLDVIPFD